MKRIFVTSLWDSKLKAALEADPAMKDICNIKGAGETPSLTKWLRNYVLRYQPEYSHPSVNAIYVAAE